MSRLIVTIIAVMLCLATYALVRRNHLPMDELHSRNELVSAGTQSLPALDAHGIGGVRELKKSELINLVTQQRPLSQFENAQLDRGCPGLACLYQGLGLTRWPESARGTPTFLRLEDALNRSCPEGRENFVFLKQAWWTSGKPPTPDPTSGGVPLSSVTRAKPDWYTFNYAVYFPATKTYVWINHREYGFPANLLWPMKAYLSLSPPPLTRTVQRSITAPPVGSANFRTPGISFPCVALARVFTRRTNKANRLERGRVYPGVSGLPICVASIPVGSIHGRFRDRA